MFPLKNLARKGLKGGESDIHYAGTWLVLKVSRDITDIVSHSNGFQQ